MIIILISGIIIFLLGVLGFQFNDKPINFWLCIIGLILALPTLYIVIHDSWLTHNAKVIKEAFNN